MHTRMHTRMHPYLRVCVGVMFAQAASPDVSDGETTAVQDAVPAEALQVATFGGGCFWCLDAVLRSVHKCSLIRRIACITGPPQHITSLSFPLGLIRGIKGVVTVTSGFTGGTVANPTYEQVSGGGTGHAEVIQVQYDSRSVRYEDLLKVGDRSVGHCHGWCALSRPSLTC
jgi:hypothetical protein